jgi:hypothetical protein
LWLYELYGRAAILSRLSWLGWKTGLPSLSLLTVSLAACAMVLWSDQWLEPEEVTTDMSGFAPFLRQ